MTVLAGIYAALAGSISLQSISQSRDTTMLTLLAIAFLKVTFQGVCSVNVKCMLVQSDHQYLSHATHNRAPGVSLMPCSQVGCYVTHTCQQGSW